MLPFCWQVLQQHPTRPWRSCRWIWNLSRQGLLVGQELLGNQLGTGRLHHDVEEQEQSVWNFYKGQLSTCLGSMVHFFGSITLIDFQREINCFHEVSGNVCMFLQGYLTARNEVKEKSDLKRLQDNKFKIMDGLALNQFL